MKTLLVPALISLFALPAVAGEMPEVTPAPQASTTATAVTTGDVAATVPNGDSKALKKSMPSYSGYGCDRGHASTETMLIN